MEHIASEFNAGDVSEPKADHSDKSVCGTTPMGNYVPSEWLRTRWVVKYPLGSYVPM